MFAFSFVAMLIVWAVGTSTKRQPGEPDPPTKAVQAAVQRWETELQKGVPGIARLQLAENKTVLQIGGFPDVEVLFDAAKFDLSGEDRERIGQVAEVLREILKRDAHANLMIAGTADERPFVRASPPRDNMELSALRATEVAKVLAERHLRERVFVRGLGEVTEGCGSAEDEEGSVDPYRGCRRVTLELRHDWKLSEAELAEAAR